MNRLSFFSKGTSHSHSFQVYPMVPLQICEPGKRAKLGCKLVGLPKTSNIFWFLAAVNPWQKMVEKTGPTSAEVGNCQGLGGQHEEGQHPSEQFIHWWRAVFPVNFKTLETWLCEVPYLWISSSFRNPPRMASRYNISTPTCNRTGWKSVKIFNFSASSLRWMD